jgi:hypothetical protein
MAAVFPSIYCQVRVVGSRLSCQLYGSKLSFHLMAGNGQLAAGFLTSYMATGFHEFINVQFRLGFRA